jgi:UDP-2-acetamido-3-amino-2,3-dideoxy-glucuronate N-acetyltransferase
MRKVKAKKVSERQQAKSDYLAHPTSFIEKGAKIGQGAKIWHNTHVTETAVIGKDSSIGQNCYIAGTVGENCKIQNNVNVYLGVEMKNHVFCGPSMTFTNDLNPRAKYPKHGNYVGTKIKTGASFGAHSTIVCGTTIGKWAFIGAGSVVTKSVPDYAIVYGTPARVKGWMCECGEKLPKEFKTAKCKKCERKYEKDEEKVKEVK